MCVWLALCAARKLSTAVEPQHSAFSLAHSPTHTPTPSVWGIRIATTSLRCGCFTIRSSFRYCCFSLAALWGSVRSSDAHASVLLSLCRSDSGRCGLLMQPHTTAGFKHNRDYAAASCLARRGSIISIMFKSVCILGVFMR